MCRVLQGIAESGYYASVESLEPSRRGRSGTRTDPGKAVEQVHAESHGIYGSAKIAESTTASRTTLESACRNTVATAMRELGLKSRVSQGLHADDDQGRSDSKRPAANKLDRDFTAEATEPQVGDRYHLPAYGRWLGLPGRGARLVQPQSGRLVDWGLVGNRVGERSTARWRSKVVARPEGKELVAPQRSWLPVHQHTPISRTLLDGRSASSVR